MPPKQVAPLLFLPYSHRENVPKGSTIVDVSSYADPPYFTLSPMWAHGGIPIPGMRGQTSDSVEGIWQGLKVFESVGIDETKFAVTSGKGLKRTVRKHGRVRGHQQGTDSDKLLDYVTARKLIYLPSYRWVLEHKLQDETRRLRQMAVDRAIVLLDYETNMDVEDTSKPLSHAGLVVRFLEDCWPA